MRTIEVVLVLVNLLFLFLSFKKLSWRVRFAIGGVNLSVFLIHGIFEGFRYQMGFFICICHSAYTDYSRKSKLQV
jgi:uncharacterized membrane protein YeiH